MIQKPTGNWDIYMKNNFIKCFRLARGVFKGKIYKFYYLKTELGCIGVILPDQSPQIWPTKWAMNKGFDIRTRLKNARQGIFPSCCHNRRLAKESNINIGRAIIHEKEDTSIERLPHRKTKKEKLPTRMARAN